MQLQMSFLETRPASGSPPVWAVLDDEQQAVVVATLARLIMKVAISAREERPVDKEEKTDD
jgi:hypothetical protein